MAALRSSSKNNPRLVRWLLALNAYRIDYEHRSGAKHGDADGLSRAFQVPANTVYEKNDDVDPLCCLENDEFGRGVRRWWDIVEPGEGVVRVQGETEALNAMRIKEVEERESYVLPEREELIASQKDDDYLARERQAFEVLLVKYKEGLA